MLKVVKGIVSPFYDPENNIENSDGPAFLPITYEESDDIESEIEIEEEMDKKMYEAYLNSENNVNM